MINQIKHVRYEYLTLSETIKQNGDRHKLNGDNYLAKGMLKHAVGSYRKAAKNYQRAYDLSYEGMLKKYIDETGQQTIEFIGCL